MFLISLMSLIYLLHGRFASRKIRVIRQICVPNGPCSAHPMTTELPCHAL